MKTIVATALMMCWCVVSVYAQTSTLDDISTPQIAQNGSPAQSSPTPVSIAPPHKSMTATVLLGLFVPGGGNFYTGQKAKGAIVLGAAVAGYALMLSSVTNEISCSGSYLYFNCSNDYSKGRLYGGMAIASGASIYGLISAIQKTGGINSGKVTALQRLHFSFPASKKSGLRVAYNWNF